MTTDDLGPCPDYDHCPAKPAIISFKDWQERQNGSLQRIEQKVDRLFFATLGGLSAVVVATIGAIIGLS